MTEKEKLKDRLATLGMKLCDLVSYAEIVGGVTVNRQYIRKVCDEIQEKKIELDKIEIEEG